MNLFVCACSSISSFVSSSISLSGARREVNDLRICRAEDLILCVDTAQRYPSGLRLLNINSLYTTHVSPAQTKGICCYLYYYLFYFILFY